MGKKNINKTKAVNSEDQGHDNLNQTMLTTKEIKDRLKNNSWLVNGASPYIERLIKYINEEKCSIFLTDTESCILHIASGEKLTNDLKKNYIIPGTFPLPSSALDASINSLVLNDNDISEAKGDFVTSEQKGQWICWSTTIKSISLETQGYIGLYAHNEIATKHLPALLKLCTKCIEQELSFSHDRLMAKKLFDEQLNIFNRHSQADIIIKESGKVELISDKACELLGLPREEIVNKNISAIIPSWDSIPLPSTKWNEVENIEVEITNSPNSGLYLLNAKALRKSSGKIDEIVCTLRSIKQALNEANKYIGNKAVFTFDDLVGISTPMKKILKEAKMFALGNSPIMILGEKFTGKKILAEAIHNHSNRHDYGFLKVDLSNLTPDEMDETLWGLSNNHKPYLRRISKPGAFEFADGGTIYIKEIGQMPISLQKKLLKTISTGSVTRLGSLRSTKVDVRVITSNSVDLTTQIEKGEFLLDLFYSLSTASLRVPPLRERKADISSLLNYFMQLKSLEIGKTPPEIPKKFVFLLKRYEWPMNFKEMREFVAILFNDQGKMFKNFKNERDFKQKHLYLDHLKELDSIVPLDEVEMHHIIKAYRAFNGSISKASRRLGVSRNTLYLKLKKYGIEDKN